MTQSDTLSPVMVFSVTRAEILVHAMTQDSKMSLVDYHHLKKCVEMAAFFSWWFDTVKGCHSFVHAKAVCHKSYKASNNFILSQLYFLTITIDI